MLDIRYIRENADRVQEASFQKGYKDVDIKKLLELDELRREYQQQVDVLRTQRNEIAARMKGSSGNPDQAVIDEGKKIKVALAEIEDRLKSVESDYIVRLKKVPNIPSSDVPIGVSEDENIVSKVVGEPTKFDFEPKSYADIAYSKGWLDKERAAKVAGSRFAYLKGDAVKLQFALVQFVMDKLSSSQFLREIILDNELKVSDKPFLPILPPYMIRTELYDAMDRLEPRDDRYKIEDEDLWLQGSAEHVLGSMHAEETLEESDLPMRYIGYASSFRREAGTYGKDMEGTFRMHQFDKLEMESLGRPEDGLNEHLFMIAIQEKLMQLLEIPYHVLMKCTVDIGKPNSRGVDIEAWLPSQQKYRETHTADYMTDYQARRLATKVRRDDGSIELVHTNDATALALSRGPIAIIENHQTKEGDVVIPEVLRPYMNNRERI